MVKKIIKEFAIYSKEDGHLVDVLNMTDKEIKKYKKDNPDLDVEELEDTEDTEDND